VGRRPGRGVAGGGALAPAHEGWGPRLLRRSWRGMRSWRWGSCPGTPRATEWRGAFVLPSDPHHTTPRESVMAVPRVGCELIVELANGSLRRMDSRVRHQAAEPRPPIGVGTTWIFAESPASAIRSTVCRQVSSRTVTGPRSASGPGRSSQDHPEFADAPPAHAGPSSSWARWTHGRARRTFTHRMVDPLVKGKPDRIVDAELLGHELVRYWSSDWC
jgi:hypothetical protein